MIFYKNQATNSGTIACQVNCDIMFTENSTLEFSSNVTKCCGIADCYSNSVIIVKGNSNVMFTNNKATTADGGALMCDTNASFIYKESSLSVIYFIYNSASDSGGGMCFVQGCAFTYSGGLFYNKVL